MKITPTYLVKAKPKTEEEVAALEQSRAGAEAKRQAEAQAQAEAEARANGMTVSLSDKSLGALVLVDDLRLRKNIQWGIVRGLLVYSLIMVPVAFVAALILAGMNSR